MKNNRTFLEKLLDGAEVEWKSLMDLAEIGTGNSNRQDEEENGQYPFYVAQNYGRRDDGAYNKKEVQTALQRYGRHAPMPKRKVPASEDAVPAIWGNSSRENN